MNLAFWDVVAGEYRSYHRDFRKDGATDLILAGVDRGPNTGTAANPNISEDPTGTGSRGVRTGRAGQQELRGHVLIRGFS
jgi:hypothetical protein